MNNDRRAEIQSIGPELTMLTELVSRIRDQIEQVRDDEQEYLDSMPDGLKNSDRGTASESAIAALDQALNEFDNMDTNSVVSCLEEAADRTVDARTLKCKQTRAEPNFDVLPKYAKDRIAQLETTLERVKKDAAAAFGDPTGAAKEILAADYQTVLTGKVLPCERVCWPKYDIEAYVEKDIDGVLIRSKGFSGGLAIEPRSSNQIIVRLQPWH
jgi:hypothetical protein